MASSSVSMVAFACDVVPAVRIGKELAQKGLMQAVAGASGGDMPQNGRAGQGRIADEIAAQQGPPLALGQAAPDAEG